MMQQYLTLTLTAVVTVTTVIYTFYSIRLWRTSRQYTDISRQAALATLWSELNRYIEICKQENRPETELLQQLSGVFAEYMIASLFTDTNTRHDPNIRDFKQKIENIMAKKDFETSTLQWLSPFMPKKK